MLKERIISLPLSRKKNHIMNNPMRFLYLPLEIQKRNKNSHGTNKTISWAWKCQSSEGRCYLLLHLANIDFLKGKK